ncbi:hypothetical protein PU298_004660 [Enterobacter kobei]
MSTITREFTKEQLQQIIETDHVQCGEASALARIALASLEAEAVCVIDQSNLDYLKSGSDADVWPASRAEMGDVLLYRSATPAPVSVPAAMEMDDDFDSAFEHGKAVGWNAYRAAMLQGADGNSPVIPDGWKLVPIDPTKDMLRAGQSVVGFWLNTVHCYSKMLAAAPAAPQQEVTQALAKGMERYGDAMRELAKKEEK